MTYEIDHVAANAIIPAPAVAYQPKYALVEIFGHRSHYGEIREVEAFGAKLLEVCDADTGKLHRYGGAAIFSITDLSQAEFDEHVARIARRKEQEAEYERKRELRIAEAARKLSLTDMVSDMLNEDLPMP